MTTQQAASEPGPSQPVVDAVRRNVQAIRARVQSAAERARRDPRRVRLVAVSKTFPAELVVAAIHCGVEDIGENRVQEAVAKIASVRAMGGSPSWHLVGHLQGNKVKSALEYFAIIHSVDSIHLADRIDRFAVAPFPVLLQVNVARESTKSGFVLPESESPMLPDGSAGNAPGDELYAALDRLRRLRNLDVRGLMTIAPQVTLPEQARPYFRCLRELADRLGLGDLSMGMTEDFEIAVEEGSTLIRLGRAVFGDRPKER